MLDNKRRIGERKNKICLFHYPHDKVPPQKKKTKLNPSTQHKNNLTKKLNGKLSPTTPAKEKKNAQG
jgi:hypothetical protein